MTEVTLKNLKIKNFKGIKSLELDFNHSTNISGRNKTGKTTIIDAYNWLLDNKDSKGQSNFQIKTVDKATGKVLHKLEHTVEGLFRIDGKDLILRKTYKENWTKKRGTNKESYTGDTTDYYIDGLKVKKKEYQDRIEQIINAEIFTLLCNVKYFNEELKWQDRRRLLVEIAGVETLTDYVQAKIDTNNKSVEDFTKLLKQKMKGINDEIKEIPTRIDELDKVQKPEISISQIEKELEQARKKELELNNKHAEILYNVKVEQKEKKVHELTQEMNTIITQARDNMERELEVLSEKREKLDNKSRELNKKYFEVEQKINNAKSNIDMLTARESQGREIICPECNTSFSIDKVDNMPDIHAYSAKLPELKAKKADIDESIKSVTKQLNEITAEMTEKKQMFKENTRSYTEDTNKEIERISKEIEAIKDSNTGEMEKIMQEIKINQGKIAELHEHRNAWSYYNGNQTSIKELEDKEKELAKKYESFEEKLYNVESLTRQYMEKVNNSINSMFSYIDFKLFEVQINEGIREICEAEINGVTYNNLNNGSQINAGIDIINVLSDYYNVSMPIFIDNAESVTDYINTDHQTVKLTVTEDEKLKIM